MCHPTAVPLTKILNPNFPLCMLHKDFERIKINNKVHECLITDDMIVPVTKDNFLKAIGISLNTNGFLVVEPEVEEFQEFLNQIGLKWIYKSKEFKKFVVPGIWTTLMHIVMKGLSRKHGGSESMSKDWLYLVYSIYIGQSNAFDLPKVLWHDFWKPAICKKQKRSQVWDFGNSHFNISIQTYVNMFRWWLTHLRYIEILKLLNLIF